MEGGLLQNECGYTFSSFQDEWYANPTLVVDMHDSCTECDAARVLGDVVLVFESGLPTVFRFGILSDDGIVVL